MQKQIVVINSEARILQATFKNNDPSGTVALKPGTNIVDRTKWDEVIKLPVVQTWLKTLSEDSDAPHGAHMLDVSEGVPALDAAGADRLLRQTYDEKVLAQWEKEEVRGDIKTLIAGRSLEIAKIKQQAREEQRKTSGKNE